MSEGWRKKARRRVAVFAIIVGSLLIVWTSKAYVACKDDEADQTYYEQQYQSAPFIFVRFIWRVETRCTGAFLDGHSEAVIAFFTIVLAVSTILLWNSTERAIEKADVSSERQSKDMRAYIKEARRLAVAAEKQLNILECPHVFPIDLRLHGPVAYCVEVQLRNYGRSPALLKDIEVRFVVQNIGKRAFFPLSGGEALVDRVKRFNLEGTILGERETTEVLNLDVPEVRGYWTAIQKREVIASLIIDIKGEDLFKDTYESWRRYTWDPEHGRFVHGVGVSAETQIA